MSQLIRDLPCGARVKFGSYSVDGEAPHKVRWIKVDSDGTFLTERIEDIRPFDAKEPNNPNRQRQAYGNNRYSVSNIDQFLNSNEERFYQQRHEYDQAPTDDYVYDDYGYENHHGFLKDFEEWEIEAILYSEITTAIPECDGDETHETIARKVFLPSLTNLTGRTVRNVREGKKWEYFETASKVAMVTDAVVDYSPISEDNDLEYDIDWYYLLRSPYEGNGCYVRYVSRDGDSGWCDACGGVIGARPALKINPEIFVSDEPDTDGYYEVLQKEIIIVDVSEDEFFSILMG